MPTYDYKCKCGFECELKESIKADPTTLCPSCENHDMYRVISGGYAVFINPGITTIGKQAEVNAKKLGKYKMSEIEETTPKKDGKMAFTDKEKRKKINKMSPEKLEKYIIEGK